eukprot:TRINITY_DN171_c0_g1_i1.p1 TRINITY_DN171_c0_g1~~TRINITY_DN171_c0_g1_i1.p1  ORF type:complete len:105 (-),score=15.28 TRINITY_DN171_c0_g1_i1:344-658(-)
MALSTISSITISVPVNALIFITVTGQNVKFGNLGFSGTYDPSRVLWNFVDASALTMTGMEMVGSILAPKAAIGFSNGEISGSICGSSFQGNGGMKWFPFQSQDL